VNERKARRKNSRFQISNGVRLKELMLSRKEISGSVKWRKPTVI
jgi:hypothetical protein